MRLRTPLLVLLCAALASFGVWWWVTDPGTHELPDALAVDDAMAEVEAFAKSRERIHREEWDTMYRRANDAFAVLSIHLDANEPGDREELESAHRRLQEGLRRVRVRGKKFSDI